jgi:tetratricopeptide (TPR) repeat protein
MSGDLNLGWVLYARFAVARHEKRTALLEEAVAAYRDALKERTRNRVPVAWASTKHNLGIALEELGEHKGSTSLLEAAIDAYREALKVRTRECHPLDWAKTQRSLERAERILQRWRR